MISLKKVLTGFLLTILVLGNYWIFSPQNVNADAFFDDNGGSWNMNFSPAPYTGGVELNTVDYPQLQPSSNVLFTPGSATTPANTATGVFYSEEIRPLLFPTITSWNTAITYVQAAATADVVSCPSAGSGITPTVIQASGIYQTLYSTGGTASLNYTLTAQPCFRLKYTLSTWNFYPSQIKSSEVTWQRPGSVTGTVFTENNFTPGYQSPIDTPFFTPGQAIMVCVNDYVPPSTQCQDVSLTGGVYNFSVPYSNTYPNQVYINRAMSPGLILSPGIAQNVPGINGITESGESFITNSSEPTHTFNFGYLVGPSQIHGDVWHDKNHNSTYELSNELVYNNAGAIKLYKDNAPKGELSKNDTLILETTTNYGGYYEINGLSNDDGEGDGDYDYIISQNLDQDKENQFFPISMTSLYTYGYTQNLWNNEKREQDQGIARGTVWYDDNLNGVVDVTDHNGILDSSEQIIPYQNYAYDYFNYKRTWKDENRNGVIDSGIDFVISTPSELSQCPTGDELCVSNLPIIDDNPLYTTVSYIYEHPLSPELTNLNLSPTPAQFGGSVRSTQREHTFEFNLDDGYDVITPTEIGGVNTGLYYNNNTGIIRHQVELTNRTASPAGITVSLYEDVGTKGQYDPGIDVLYTTDSTDSEGKVEFNGLPFTDGELDNDSDYIVLTDSSSAVFTSNNLIPNDGSVYNAVELYEFDPARQYIHGSAGSFEGFNGVNSGSDMRWGIEAYVSTSNSLNNQIVSGVTVELRDSTNTVLGTAVTDAKGYYYFKELTDQNNPKTVNVVSLPAGLTAPNPPCSIMLYYASSPIESCYLSVVSQAQLIVSPYVDVNENNVMDPLETDIGYFKLALHPIGSATSLGLTDLNSSTQCDFFDTFLPDSRFVCNGLAPGNYILTTEDFRHSYCDRSQLITVTSFNQVQTKEIKCSGRAEVSGKIWNDINNNGFIDAGENGISGVEVGLNIPSISYPGLSINSFSYSLKQVGNKLTDSNGNYSYKTPLRSLGYSPTSSFTNYVNEFNARQVIPVTVSGPLNGLSQTFGIANTFKNANFSGNIYNPQNIEYYSYGRGNYITYNNYGYIQNLNYQIANIDGHVGPRQTLLLEEGGTPVVGTPNIEVGTSNATTSNQALVRIVEDTASQYAIAEASVDLSASNADWSGVTTEIDPTNKKVFINNFTYANQVIPTVPFSIYNPDYYVYLLKEPSATSVYMCPQATGTGDTTPTCTQGESLIADGINHTFAYDGLLKYNITTATIGANTYWKIHTDLYTSTNGAGFMNPVSPITLSSSVYTDTNKNGTLDLGETGIAGQTVRVWKLGDTNTSSYTTTVSGISPVNLLPSTTYTIFLDTVPLGNYPTSPLPYTITTPATGTVDYNFGVMTNSASIGNQIFIDQNNDQQYTLADTALSGVTVDAYQDTDNNGVLNGVETSTITASGTSVISGVFSISVPFGIYSNNLFTPGVGVGAGTFVAGTQNSYRYFTKVNTSQTALLNYNSVLYSGTPLADNVARNVAGYEVTNSLPSTTNNSSDFGFVLKTASIGNQVFLDANNNQTFDAGDSGILGVVVSLYQDNGTTSGTYDVSDTFVASQTTPANGTYSFTNQPYGNYIVRITTPPVNLNAVAGLSSLGVNNTAKNSSSYAVTLNNAAIYNQFADFGYTPPPTVSGIIFEDLNGNGIMEITEPDISPGYSIVIWKNGDPNLTATVSTTALGYSYNLQPNTTYTVYWVNSGLYPTKPMFCTFTTATIGNTVCNFAGIQPVNFAFGNQVFEDKNNDGIFNGTDVGMNGVLVDVYRDSDNNGILNGAELTTIIYTASTGGAGTYVTTQLALGTINSNVFTPGIGLSSGVFTPGGGTPYRYFIKVNATQPALANYNHFLYTGAPLSDNVSRDLNNYSVVTAVTSPRINNSADFGFTIKTGLIGGKIFNDVNTNGVFDVGETGIGAGKTVELRNSSNTLIETVVTSGTGDYVFTAKPIGNYTVTEVISSTTNYPTSPKVVATSITAIALNPSINFGLANNSITLGNLVFSDLNSNGIFDSGETGVNNVTIELYRDTNNNGVLDGLEITTLIASTNTNISGAYSFTTSFGDPITTTPFAYKYFFVVNPSQFSLTNFAHILYSGVPQSDNVSRPLSGYSLTGITPTTTLNSADFGFHYTLPTGTLLGVVFNDTNTNGVQDPSETTGIAQATIELTDLTGTVLNTTTTDSNGNYTFITTPASYCVKIRWDSATVTVLGKQLFSPSGPQSYCPVVITQFLTTAQNFAGITNETSVGDQVFNDKNDDGYFDPAIDSGIGGVMIDIFLDLNANGVIDSGESIVDTISTNSNGNYNSALTLGFTNNFVTTHYRYILTVNAAQPSLIRFTPNLSFVQANNYSSDVSGTQFAPSLTNLIDTSKDFGFQPFASSPRAETAVDVVTTDQLQWKTEFINDQNKFPVLAKITSPVPVDTTYVEGTLECVPVGLVTITSCVYNPTTNSFDFVGTLGYTAPVAVRSQHNLFETSVYASDALNRVILKFKTLFNKQKTSFAFQSLIQWDENNDNSVGVLDFNVANNATALSDDPLTSAQNDPTIYRIALIVTGLGKVIPIITASVFVMLLGVWVITRRGKIE
jgi:hypothetical protein